MAGKDLYIQPIIDNSLSAMTANIASMNTQLSETTRILMNILNNQGLEQHQSVYTGSAFGGLTLSAPDALDYCTPNFTHANLTETARGQYGYIEYSSNSSGISVNFSGLYYNHLNLKGAINVRFKILMNTAVVSTATNLIFADGTTTPLTIDGDYLVAAIPENQRTKQTVTVLLNTTVKLTVNTVYAYPAEMQTETGGAYVSEGLLEFATIKFVNNILQYKVTHHTGFTAVYPTVTGYITIPDIQNVSTWVSAILKGNLDGISIALVDKTSHDLIKVLPTATSDLSDVQQFSNLALMVTFAGDGNALKFMSGFTMRYY